MFRKLTKVELRYIRYLKEIYLHFPVKKLFILPIIWWIITSLCVYFDYTYNMRIVVSFFFVWIFFVFSIVTSIVNERRFQAYNEIALIKANLLSTLQIIKAKNIPEEEEIFKNISKIMFRIQDNLRNEDEEKDFKLMKKMDDSISYLAKLAEIMLKNWISSSESSRIQQFLAQINFSTQKLIYIKQKRTPKLLKLFLYLSLPISVILLSPWFAELWILWVISSVIIAFLLSMLLIIQNKIEKPFSWEIDDIRLRNIAMFTKRIKNV